MTTYNQFICGNNGDALEIRNESTTGLRNPSQWLVDWATGGHKNDAGVVVNGYTALTHCPLWQGVNIIAGDFGQTPVRLLRNRFTEQRQHPAWHLLRVRPNQLQTPAVWKETMMQWKLIWGNAVSWIVRTGSRITDLIPLRPDCLRFELVGYEGSQILLYHYHSAVTEAEYTFFPWEVLHFQGLTSDGIIGYPLWQIAKNTIGHGLALEKHGNKQFANGAMPSGVLEHPGRLQEEARRNLRADWESTHKGADNTGKIAILWEGMKFNPISMNNQDAQWLEDRKFNVYESAALLNLPPHKLGAMEDSSTRANIEEQNADYESRTLSRHYNGADEEYRRKLLTDSEWRSDEYAFEHDASAFLKGDLDTKSVIADRNMKATIWNSNEARSYLGYPPREGGEVYGSPAINPNENSPSSMGKTPKPPRNTDNMAHKAHRDLLFDRILHLLECENTRIRHAVTNVRLFTKWLDEFYLDGGFASLAEQVMGTSVRASLSAGMTVSQGPALQIYAKHRHTVLLEACSTITKEELPAAVESLINSERELVAQGLLTAALGERNGTEN